MKSLEKRIEKIELEQQSKNYKPPYLALVNEDGTVDVSHAYEDDFTLPNKEALDKFIEENNLDTGNDYISMFVITVASKDEEPDVE